MLLVFTHIWQVVSEAPACQDSTHSILTSWHLITVTKGGAIALWSVSSLVTVTGCLEKLYRHCNCVPVRQAQRQPFVRFVKRKEPDTELSMVSQ